MCLNYNLKKFSDVDYFKVNENGLRKHRFNDEDFNMDLRKINAMSYLPVQLIPQVWKLLEKDLKDRSSKSLPVFDHFSKYLVLGYTNSKGDQVPPKWGPQMWSVYGKVLENRTRTTDKLEAWHRRLQAIILRPHPDMDTFVRTLCEEWIFIKMNIKKHLAKLDTFDVAKKSFHDREHRISRIVFNMPSFHGSLEYLEAIARVTKC